MLESIGITTSTPIILTKDGMLSVIKKFITTFGSIESKSIVFNGYNSQKEYLGDATIYMTQNPTLLPNKAYFTIVITSSKGNKSNTYDFAWDKETPIKPILDKIYYLLYTDFQVRHGSFCDNPQFAWKFKLSTDNTNEVKKIELKTDGTRVTFEIHTIGGHSQFPYFLDFERIQKEKFWTLRNAYPNNPIVKDAIALFLEWYTNTYIPKGVQRLKEELFLK